MVDIYYSDFEHEEGKMILAATENGLCWAGGFNETEDDMENWVKRQYPASSLLKVDHKLDRYKEAFYNYFSGHQENFNIPLDLQGTPFQVKVWDELQTIPFGETRSYSDIAERIGNPRSIRAVGTAVGRNPVLIAVPCHRIIQKNGNLGGFRAGLPLKRALLKHEQTGT